MLECYIAIELLKKGGDLVRTNNLFCFDTTRTGCKTTRPTILLLLRYIHYNGSLLPIRCLAAAGWETHTDTQRAG
jgi:hypothetical protein